LRQFSSAKSIECKNCMLISLHKTAACYNWYFLCAGIAGINSENISFQLIFFHRKRNKTYCSWTKKKIQKYLGNTRQKLFRIAWITHRHYSVRQLSRILEKRNIHQSMFQQSDTSTSSVTFLELPFTYIPIHHWLICICDLSGDKGGLFPQNRYCKIWMIISLEDVFITLAKKKNQEPSHL
jgi:hypothetical protein